MNFNDMVRSLQGHKNNTDYSKIKKSDWFNEVHNSIHNIYINTDSFGGFSFEMVWEIEDQMTFHSYDNSMYICFKFNPKSDDVLEVRLKQRAKHGDGPERIMAVGQFAVQPTANPDEMQWQLIDIMEQMIDDNSYAMRNYNDENYNDYYHRKEWELTASSRKIKKHEFDSIDDLICDYLQVNGPSTARDIASDELIAHIGIDIEPRLRLLVDMGEITHDGERYSSIYPTEI